MAQFCPPFFYQVNLQAPVPMEIIKFSIEISKRDLWKAECSLHGKDMICHILFKGGFDFEWFRIPVDGAMLQTLLMIWMIYYIRWTLLCYFYTHKGKKPLSDCIIFSIFWNKGIIPPFLHLGNTCLSAVAFPLESFLYWQLADMSIFCVCFHLTWFNWYGSICLSHIPHWHDGQCSFIHILYITCTTCTTSQMRARNPVLFKWSSFWSFA